MPLNSLPVDWLYGLGGGLLIGASAALLLLANGRILGASGIFGGLVEGSGARGLTEYLPFVAALIIAPALAVALTGAPDTHVTGDLPMLALAGVLVGVGTRLANGCTSGHGVCGMSRFSLRSIAATLVYLAVGMATFFVARHILGVI